MAAWQSLLSKSLLCGSVVSVFEIAVVVKYRRLANRESRGWLLLVHSTCLPITEVSIVVDVAVVVDCQQTDNLQRLDDGVLCLHTIVVEMKRGSRMYGSHLEFMFARQCFVRAWTWIDRACS